MKEPNSQYKKHSSIKRGNDKRFLMSYDRSEWNNLVNRDRLVCIALKSFRLRYRAAVVGTMYQKVLKAFIYTYLKYLVKNRIQVMNEYQNLCDNSMAKTTNEYRKQRLLAAE